MALLDDFKIDIGIFDGSRDAVLNRVLAKAKTDIIAFTHQSEGYVLKHLSESVLDLATVRYNQKNGEGLTSQSNSGSSETYINDIPLNIQRVLVVHRKVKWK